MRIGGQGEWVETGVVGMEGVGKEEAVWVALAIH